MVCRLVDAYEGVCKGVEGRVGMLTLVQFGLCRRTNRRKGVLLPCPNGAVVEVLVRLKDDTAPVRPLSGVDRDVGVRGQ